MEYPTLFTAGTRWLAPRRWPTPKTSPCTKPGTSSGTAWSRPTSSSTRGWTRASTRSRPRASLEQFFGPQYYSKRYFGGFVPWVFDDLPLSRATDGNYLSGYRDAGDADANRRRRGATGRRPAGAITYYKTALWLNTLERMLGWETLQQILSTYFARYSFKHPEPKDFFAVANEVSGRDLTLVLRSGLSQLERLRLRRRRLHERAGVRPRLSSATRAGRSSPPTSAPATLYRTRVVVRRVGDGDFPVTVRVVFENNQEVRWQWDGRDRWKMFEVDRPVRAVTAEVDPDRVLLLDANYTNNTRSLAPKTNAAARKWSLAWLDLAAGSSADLWLLHLDLGDRG